MFLPIMPEGIISGRKDKKKCVDEIGQIQCLVKYKYLGIKSIGRGLYEIQKWSPHCPNIKIAGNKNRKGEVGKIIWV